MPPPLTFSTAIQLLVFNEAFPKRKTGKQKTRVLPFKQLLSKFFIRTQLYDEGAFLRMSELQSTAPMANESDWAVSLASAMLNIPFH